MGVLDFGKSGITDSGTLAFWTLDVEPGLWILVWILELGILIYMTKFWNFGFWLITEFWNYGFWVLGPGVLDSGWRNETNYPEGVVPFSICGAGCGSEEITPLLQHFSNSKSPTVNGVKK